MNLDGTRKMGEYSKQLEKELKNTKRNLIKTFIRFFISLGIMWLITTQIKNSNIVILMMQGVSLVITSYLAIKALSLLNKYNHLADTIRNY